MSDQQQPPWEYQKWLHELQRSDALRVHDKFDEFQRHMNEAAISTSTLALRTALLINGGATVALLSFSGQLPDDQRKLVAAALIWFAWGVFASAVGIALAYLTHYCMVGISNSMIRQWILPYLHDGPSTPKWKIGNRIFHVAALLAGLAALILFIYGMFEVKAALSI